MSNAGTTEKTSTAETTAAVKPGMGAVLVPVMASTVFSLCVVGGAVFYLLHTGKLGASVPAAAVAPGVIVMAPPASHVVALEPILVNLSDAGGRSYLRAGVSLRIKDDEKKEEKKEEKKDPKALDSVVTALRDTTLAVLSLQTSDKLLSINGREDLKKALQQEYRQRNTETPVLEVFFTDFLVQRG